MESLQFLRRVAKMQFNDLVRKQEPNWCVIDERASHIGLTEGVVKEALVGTDAKNLGRQRTISLSEHFRDLAEKPWRSMAPTKKSYTRLVVLASSCALSV